MKTLSIAALLCWSMISLPIAVADEPAHVQELMMVRLNQAFPEAMNIVQQAIVASGYQLMRVQRVDIGLTRSGYQTAEYRVVFFGKKDEIRTLADRHPNLIPFLPLKLVVFAEGEETIVLATNPAKLRSFYPDKTLAPYFQKWEKDFQQIFKRIQS